MSIETKVEGNPDQITSLASWLTSSLEPAVSTSWRQVLLGQDESWLGMAG